MNPKKPSYLTEIIGVAVLSASLIGCGRPCNYESPTYEQIEEVACTEVELRELSNLYSNPENFLSSRHALEEMKKLDIKTIKESILHESKLMYPWIDLANPRLPDKYLIKRLDLIRTLQPSYGLKSD
ncbi:MAG: hypothetical protein Q8L29_01620 [archaeon]|nr:hypothetical protein [archaeon]